MFARKTSDKLNLEEEDSALEKSCAKIEKDMSMKKRKLDEIIGKVDFGDQCIYTESLELSSKHKRIKQNIGHFYYNQEDAVLPDENAAPKYAQT